MKTPLPPFLLLDLDDTILDYDGPGAACWDHFCQIYAERTGVQDDRMIAAMAESRKWFWSDPDRHREGRLNQLEARRAIVGDAFRRLGLDRMDLREEFAVCFTRERELWIRPFPGALETLASLSEAGTRMALVTNGQASQQRAKVERFDLEKYFEAIFIEGERGFGKPDERVFRAALEAIGAEANDAWMAGDDLVFDIRPAKAFGLRTVWINQQTDAQKDPAADRMETSFSGWISQMR